MNKVPFDAETRYFQKEKLIIPPTVIARKLKPSLQCHTIEVVTAYSLRTILHEPNLERQMAPLATKLEEFCSDLNFSHLLYF